MTDLEHQASIVRTEELNKEVLIVGGLCKIRIAKLFWRSWQTYRQMQERM